jgi:surface polysaccharide O-acyltransferase-like enzyme
MTIERNSNIELFRIVCMLMIVAGHIINSHSTTYSLQNPDELIKLFFSGGFLVAVNAFILISGYFGIRLRRERLISLIVQVLFYSVGLWLISMAVGWHTFSPKKDFQLLIPILTKQYWFVTCYVVLYVISPLLNRWASALVQDEYKRLLLIGFCLIYVWPTMCFLVNAPQFIDDAGYGIINFSYLYMLGYYLRHHYIEHHSASWYWGGYFLVVVMLFLCQAGLSFLLGFEFTSWFSYNTVFIFIEAIFLFIAFKNMKIQSSVINYLAKQCLAVYLIHKHPLIWGGFCKLIDIDSYHGVSFIAIFLTLPIVIYLACAAVEICRLWFMQPVENRIIKRLL